MKILLLSLLLALSSCNNSDVHISYFKKVTVIEVYGYPPNPDFIDVVFEDRIVRMVSPYIEGHTYVKGEDILVLVANEK